jgi:hypothetical protein
LVAPALEPSVLTALRDSLPLVAQRTVAAVTSEVPHYAASLGPTMGANIQGAVQAALDAFLRRVSRPDGGSAATPAAGLDAAYDLGRGEARSGRTIDALVTAYRVGARAAWREISSTLVDHDVSSATVADLAGGVFDYIDELSAASVAGHTDELAKSGRVREQYLEALGRALLDGEEPERLAARAERAGWEPPETLTAVILPAAQARSALGHLDPRTLVVAGDLIDTSESEENSVLLVPDAHRNRDALLDALQGRTAAVGPARPWTAVERSHHLAARAAALVPSRSRDSLDADEHLVALVVGADLDAHRDLRSHVLAPLAELRPATRDRLEETLRSWLLHQGRREEVAADLHVHPQTVRYRMNQLRALYGDRLLSPDVVEQLVVALAPPHELDAS